MESKNRSSTLNDYLPCLNNNNEIGLVTTKDDFKKPTSNMTECWGLVNIKDIVEKTSQKDPAKTPNLQFKYIDVSCISNSSLTIDSFTEYSGNNAPTRARKVIKYNDILFATIRPYLKRIALVPQYLDGQICSTAFCVIRCKSNIADPQFIFQVVSTDKFIKNVSYLQDGSGYPAVSDSDVLNQLIQLPLFHEQRKIATILSTVDTAIKVTEKIITQTENLKNQLVNILLNKSKNYNTFKLSDISELITKGTTPTTYGFKYQEHGINFIKVESISTEGAFIKTNFAYIDEETNQALKRSMLRENDILFSIAGALGRVAIVTKDILPANTNQALAIIRLKNDEKVDINYIKYYLMSIFIQNYVKLISTQSAQSNISLSQINDFKILLPDISEQRHIVKNLELINEKLKTDDNYLEHLKILKKALMQVLLTGKVRVKVDVDA